MRDSDKPPQTRRQIERDRGKTARKTKKERQRTSKSEQKKKTQAKKKLINDFIERRYNREKNRQ